MLELHPVAIAQGLALLTAANGTPVIARKLMGGRLAFPLDAEWTFVDGRRLLGASKTVRGVVVAVLASTALAPVIGGSARTGLLVGAGAMLGDLLSSFIKRRLALEPSSQASGLDQVPESLLPLGLVASPLGLSAWDIGLAVALFWGGELIVSRWLFALKLRDRPY